VLRCRAVPGTQGPPAIDIIFLIERLEALIANGRRMPMTNSVVVDQVSALDLIDQLRVAVPEEIRQAKRINEETSRLVERAQEEAERILARAQEQAAFLIEERELTRAAEIESERIIGEGRREADEIRQGADAYAASVLVKLEGECVRALQSIRRGLALLDERYPASGDGAGLGEPPVDGAIDQRAHAQL
jgi:vacuolar-type H+-ATPase subunit H